MPKYAVLFRKKKHPPGLTSAKDRLTFIQSVNANGDLKPMPLLVIIPKTQQG